MMDGVIKMRTAASIVSVVFIAVATGTTEMRAETPGEQLEGFVQTLPRGSLNIPFQWLEMESLVGWEKMMLVFGYADNKTTCDALSRIAKSDSPDRNFRCVPAN